MGCELRIGSQHSQKEFTPFPGKVVRRARRITRDPILLRRDSGHDAKASRREVARHDNTTTWRTSLNSIPAAPVRQSVGYRCLKKTARSQFFVQLNPLVSSGFFYSAGTAVGDVLEIYKLPHDSKVPLECMDETSKQQVREVPSPIQMSSGQCQRYGNEYERNGVSALFMFWLPLRGWRHVDRPRSCSGIAEAKSFDTARRQAAPTIRKSKKAGMLPGSLWRCQLLTFIFDLETRPL
ncbi:MAG: hypothetical protein OXC07_01710 [Kistimonas sp.]|nr:hypothetical protein [Kistimonas sp.]